MSTRDHATGRYTDSQLAKVCACGHRLGQHDAEKSGASQPCHACDCECFRKAAR